MLSVLDDPQTAYVEPSTMQSSFGDMFRGDFEGIGAHVQINAAGKIVIVSPIEGSPAEACRHTAGRHHSGGRRREYRGVGDCWTLYRSYAGQREPR